MARDERKIEELRALLESYGWGLVKQALALRRASQQLEILDCPLNDVARHREAIKAILEMERIPEMLLKEEEARDGGSRE